MDKKVEIGVNGNGVKGQSALEHFLDVASDNSNTPIGLESDLCKPNFNYTNPNRSSPLNLEPRIHTSYYNTEPKPEVKKKPLLKRLGKLVAVGAISLATLTGIGLVADYNGAFIKSDKCIDFTDVAGKHGSVNEVFYPHIPFLDYNFSPPSYEADYDNGDVLRSGRVETDDGRIIFIYPVGYMVGYKDPSEKSRIFFEKMNEYAKSIKDK